MFVDIFQSTFSAEMSGSQVEEQKYDVQSADMSQASADFFPKRNNVDQLLKYIDVADSQSLPCGWSRYAQFSLVVVNQEKHTMSKGICFVLFIFLCSWQLFIFIFL